MADICFGCKLAVNRKLAHVVLCRNNGHYMHLPCYDDQAESRRYDNQEYYCRACVLNIAHEPAVYGSLVEFEEQLYPLADGTSVRFARRWLSRNPALDRPALAPETISPRELAQATGDGCGPRQDTFMDVLLDAPAPASVAATPATQDNPDEETVAAFLKEHEAAPSTMHDAVHYRVCDGTFNIHCVRLLLDRHAGDTGSLLPRLSAFGLHPEILLDKFTPEELVVSLHLTFLHLCALGLTRDTFMRYRHKAFTAEKVVAVWKGNWSMLLTDICDGDLFTFLGKLDYTAQDLRTLGFRYSCTETMINFSLTKLEEAYTRDAFAICPEEWFTVLGMPRPPTSSSWRPAWDRLHP